MVFASGSSRGQNVTDADDELVVRRTNDPVKMYETIINSICLALMAS